jgi:hypothetical protein
MFQAAFSLSWCTDLVTLDGHHTLNGRGVTARVYVNVLEEHRLTELDADSSFKHNNCRIHTAKHTKGWMEDIGIEDME